MVDPSFIEETKGSSLGLEGTVMIHIFCWGLAICLVDLSRLAETAQSLFDLLAIDEAQCQHVVDDY